MARIYPHHPSADCGYGHTYKYQAQRNQLHRQFARGNIQPRKGSTLRVNLIEIERTINRDKQEGENRHEDNHRNLIRPFVYKSRYRLKHPHNPTKIESTLTPVQHDTMHHHSHCDTQKASKHRAARSQVSTHLHNVPHA